VTRNEVRIAKIFKLSEIKIMDTSDAVFMILMSLMMMLLTMRKQPSKHDEDRNVVRIAGLFSKKS